MKISFKRILPLLVLAIATTASFAKHDDATAKVIELRAKRFAFDPSEITLKKGETVTLRVTSADVTHGLYLKPLKIDALIEPGKTTDVTVTPEQTGKFVAICDHFCGAGHGNMHLIVNVVE